MELSFIWPVLILLLHENTVDFKTRIMTTWIPCSPDGPGAPGGPTGPLSPVLPEIPGCPSLPGWP